MKPRCAITNLPITYQEEIVIILLEKNNSLDREFDQPYVFKSLPIFGTFHDVYYIIDIKIDANVKIIQSFYNNTIEEILADNKLDKIYIIKDVYVAMLAKHYELYPDYFKFETYEFSRKWTRLTEWNSRKWEGQEIHYNWNEKQFAYKMDYYPFCSNDEDKKRQQEVHQLNFTLVKRYIDLFMHGHSYDKQLEDISRLYNMMGKCNLTIQPFKPIAIHGTENLLNQKWLLELSAGFCENLAIELYGSDE
jgi:hypothetical protein